MVYELHIAELRERWERSLNPCFCGRWSTSSTVKVEEVSSLPVLILVFVEDGLRVFPCWKETKRDRGLNPCFCGRWSTSEKGDELFVAQLQVLILVFVEDGLRVRGTPRNPLRRRVLILVFVEDGLRGDIQRHPRRSPSLNPCFCGRWSTSKAITESLRKRVYLS